MPEKNGRSWYSIEMAAGQTADIHIYDAIGIWGVTAKDFIKDLKAIGSVKKINLHVNSPGGDVFDGTAIYNSLKAHGATIETFIEGVAASMGSVIALAGDTVNIAENAYFMIHNPSMFVVGDERAMDRGKNLLSKVKNTMLNLYSGRSGIDAEEVAQLMDDETWYTGAEAVAAGFADNMTDAFEMAACSDLSLFDQYKNVPDPLIDAITNPIEFIFKPSAVADIKPTQEEAIMPEVNKPAATDGDQPVVTAKTETEKRAVFEAEETQRKTDIRAVFNGFEGQQTLLEECLDDLKCDVVSAKDKLLAALGKDQKPTQSRQVRVEESQETARFLADAAVAISARAGLLSAEEKKDLASNGLRGYSLFELARMSLERRSVSTSGMDKMTIVASAFTHTSSDFSSLLANTANKAMLKGYTEADEVFQRFAAVGTLPDFKTLSRVDTGTFPSLREVKEGAEYKYISLGERAESAVLATYGELFSITRQAIINDDLGAFTRIPQKMGRAAVRTVGDLVFDIFLNNPNMADGVALFHANHNNLASASVINTAGLDAARVLMVTQKDGTATLNIRPKYLLVGPQDESAAKVAVEAEFEVDGSAKNSRQPNSVRGIAEVISDARLTSAHNSWYLLADQNMHDTIEVLYLDGNSAPVLEQQRGWNVDGTEFKVRIDAAAKAWDFRTMVKTPKS